MAPWMKVNRSISSASDHERSRSSRSRFVLIRLWKLSNQILRVYEGCCRKILATLSALAWGKPCELRDKPKRLQGGASASENACAPTALSEAVFGGCWPASLMQPAGETRARR